MLRISSSLLVCQLFLCEVAEAADCFVSAGCVRAQGSCDECTYLSEAKDGSDDDESTSLVKILFLRTPLPKHAPEDPRA